MLRKPDHLSRPTPTTVADAESDALTILGAMIVLTIVVSAYLWVQ